MLSPSTCYFSKENLDEKTSPVPPFIPPLPIDTFNKPIPGKQPDIKIKKSSPPIKKQPIFITPNDIFTQEIKDCLISKGYKIGTTKKAFEIAFNDSDKLDPVDPEAPSYYYPGGYLIIKVRKSKKTIESIELQRTDPSGISEADVRRQVREEISQKINNQPEIICDEICKLLPPA